jgi:hypothetical protein
VAVGVSDAVGDGEPLFVGLGVRLRVRTGVLLRDAVGDLLRVGEGDFDRVGTGVLEREGGGLQSYSRLYARTLHPFSAQVSDQALLMRGRSPLPRNCIRTSSSAQ